MLLKRQAGTSALPLECAPWLGGAVRHVVSPRRAAMAAGSVHDEMNVPIVPRPAIDAEDLNLYRVVRAKADRHGTRQLARKGGRDETGLHIERESHITNTISGTVVGGRQHSTVHGVERAKQLSAWTTTPHLYPCLHEPIGRYA